MKVLQENIETVTVTVQELEREIDSKLNKIEFATFRDDVNKKFDDLENRSKRNNLIFWNVPEGEEKDRPRGCVSLIQDITQFYRIKGGGGSGRPPPPPHR